MDFGSVNFTLDTINSAQAGSLASKVGIALLDKELDSEKQTGDSFVKMMEQSVAPHVGGNVDVYA